MCIILAMLNMPTPFFLFFSLIGKNVYVFSEAAPVVREEAGPSEANLPAGKCIVDQNQTPQKQVKPVARLQKVLKFKVLLDDDDQEIIVQPTTTTL